MESTGSINGVNPCRECNACGKPLKGRSDKRFCGEYCRNSFNNSRKEKCTSREKQINGILHKNRSVLQAILFPGRESVRTNKLELLKQGFDFRYHTHQLNSDQGVCYFFSYEYGCAELGGGKILVVADPFYQV
jgi:predicted nucleic acid-binding Zn ribbon protein